MNANNNPYSSLSGWMNNQMYFYFKIRRYIKHLDQLQEIKLKPNKHSLSSLGLVNDYLRHKENLQYNKIRSYPRFEIIKTEKNNKILASRLIEIDKKKSGLIKEEYNHFSYDLHSPQMRIRSDKRRAETNEKIKYENHKLGERILAKPKNINVEKLQEDFEKHKVYKKFHKKFNLPQIESVGFKYMNKITPISSILKSPKSPPSMIKSESSINLWSKSTTFIK
jgi:hypothetical protein